MHNCVVAAGFILRPSCLSGVILSGVILVAVLCELASGGQLRCRTTGASGRVEAGDPRTELWISGNEEGALQAGGGAAGVGEGHYG